MNFIWNDKDADIGHYELYLYDDDDLEMDSIWFKDNTTPWCIENDKKYGYRREYAYEIGYCNGYSMHKSFDKDEDFYHREGGGYQGVKTHSIEDIKRWCENYIAQIYIKSYYNTLKELPERERRCKWFEDQGFKLEDK